MRCNRKSFTGTCCWQRKYQELVEENTQLHQLTKAAASEAALAGSSDSEEPGKLAFLNNFTINKTIIFSNWRWLSDI